MASALIDNNTTSSGKATLNQNNGPKPSRDEPIIHIQPPRHEDLQPSYAQVLHPDHQDAATHGWYGSMIDGLGRFIGTCGAVPCCICCPNPYRSVQQGTVGLVTRFGRFARAVDPGLVKVNPLSEKLIAIDVKMQIVEVPKQYTMTRDNVTVTVSSVIYYRIVAPHKTAFGISNIRQALVERTQTTLRHVIGARVLQDVIERREEIAEDIRNIVEEVAEGWGAEVESMLIRDLVFSQDLQESLSMAAQSKRTGEAKVILARAEVESAKLMRQAADILSSAPAMQIRYLEAMQAMAKSANSKVIFLPAANETFQEQIASGKSFSNAGPSESQSHDPITHGDTGMQSALNSTIIERI